MLHGLLNVFIIRILIVFIEILAILTKTAMMCPWCCSWSVWIALDEAPRMSLLR